MSTLQKSFLPPDGTVVEQWMRPPLFAGVMRPQFWRTTHWLKVNPGNALFVAMLVPRARRTDYLDEGGQAWADREVRLFPGPPYGTKGAREAYYDPRLLSCKSSLARRRRNRR